MEQAYAAIGRAVIALQIFEVAFVSIHEGFKMISDPAYREATGGIIEESRFKNATANVVKVLSQHGQIAVDLEERLNTLIDRRHELVHRWFLRHGWPDNDDRDPNTYAEVIRLAEWIRTEANAITHMMAGYMLKHARPGELDTDRDAIKEMFHRFHVQR